MNAALRIVEFPRTSPGLAEASWRGRSGRAYAMLPERSESFSLADDAIYLLASGPVITWVGTAADLVENSASRARFRLATSLACAAFRIPAPADSLARMTMVWDLEGGERLGEYSAA